METIKNVFAVFKQSLAALYDVKEAESITLIVLAEILNSSKATIKAFPEKDLSPTQQDTVNTVLTQLKTGMPLQYALGYAEFYGLKFMVNPTVLIPRPETEELVQWALDSWRLAVSSWQSPCSILDIGTGSGCIAISLKKNLPDVTVSAIDISAEALQMAKENASLNEVNVNFIQADILNSHLITHHAQLIIANPPYVTPADKEQMHTNVTGFEPHIALFVPENDPLLFYRAIADFAVANLAPNGLLFFEINENLGKETVALLESKGFRDVKLRQDMSGRDRMTKAVK